MDILIASGADPNAWDKNGNTALINASKKGGKLNTGAASFRLESHPVVQHVVELLLKVGR